jgi:hypothetical protein
LTPPGTTLDADTVTARQMTCALRGKAEHEHRRPVTVGLVTVGLVTTGLVTIGLVTTGLVTTGLVTTGLVTTGLVTIGLVTIGLVTIGTARPERVAHSRSSRFRCSFE